MHSRAAMKGSVVEVKRSSNNFSDRVVSRHVALLFRHSGRRSGHHRPRGDRLCRTRKAAIAEAVKGARGLLRTGP